MCSTPQAPVPEQNRAQLIIKYYFLGQKNVFPLVRNIQKSKEICSQFLVTVEGLLGDQAQRKEDLTVLPENVALES